MTKNPGPISGWELSAAFWWPKLPLEGLHRWYRNEIMRETKHHLIYFHEEHTPLLNIEVHQETEC